MPLKWSPERFARAWVRAKAGTRRPSAKDLSIEADVTTATIYNWRKPGHAGVPTVDQASAIAAKLGCELTDLMA